MAKDQTLNLEAKHIKKDQTSQIWPIWQPCYQSADLILKEKIRSRFKTL